MARWQCTLTDPLAQAAPIVIDLLADDGGYSRSEISKKTFDSFTLNQNALIAGPVGYRYIWAMAPFFLESDALQLRKLVRLQNRRWDAGQDGYLLWTDEVEYLDPEASPHSKTILLGSQVTDSEGFVYGFGQFKVQVDFPDSSLEHIGADVATGDPLKRLRFVVTEIGKP